MAAYREHLTASCFFGVGVASSAIALGFTPVQAVLSGIITGIGGILPDLDSESGRPVREMFGVTAALAPLLLMRRLLEWGGNTDGAMLLSVLVYISVRYGGATLLGIFAVHRGMYHSIPAMIIAGELVFLGYKSDQLAMKLLMGVGVMIGFFSHLLLDELYAVEWRGIRVRLNKFAGSAIKLTSKSWPANIFAYGLLFTLSYIVWIDGGLQQGWEEFARSLTAPLQTSPPELQIPKDQPQDWETDPYEPVPERYGWPQSRPQNRPTGRIANDEEYWPERK